MGKRRTRADNNLVLKEIVPITNNQEKAFKSRKSLLLHGSAGTGKTFISMYIAALEALENRNFSKIIIIRSAVPTRDIGFLPGTEEEKSKVYESPYIDIFNELYGRGEAYSILKNHREITFMLTSHIRGLTFNNSFVVVDEYQNMTFHELDSIITRWGSNCKMVFCGDFTQSDLSKNGVHNFMKILKEMEEFESIEFEISDIVRSNEVKNYLIAKDKVLT